MEKDHKTLSEMLDEISDLIKENEQILNRLEKKIKEREKLVAELKEPNKQD